MQGKPTLVHRSELFAIVVLCRCLIPSAYAEVVIDSLIVAKGFASRRSTGFMSGLWAELWRLVDSKNLCVSVRWLKAHGLETFFIDKHYITDLDLFGNAIADKLADRAGAGASRLRGISSKVINSFALAQKVQHRLVSILEDIVKSFPDRGLNRLEILRLLPISFFAVRSEHSLIISPGAASCSRCQFGYSGCSIACQSLDGHYLPYSSHTGSRGRHSYSTSTSLSRLPYLARRRDTSCVPPLVFLSLFSFLYCVWIRYLQVRSKTQAALRVGLPLLPYTSRS